MLLQNAGEQTILATFTKLCLFPLQLIEMETKIGNLFKGIDLKCSVHFSALLITLNPNRISFVLPKVLVFDDELAVNEFAFLVLYFCYLSGLLGRRVAHVVQRCCCSGCAYYYGSV